MRVLIEKKYIINNLQSILIKIISFKYKSRRFCSIISLTEKCITTSFESWKYKYCSKQEASKAGQLAGMVQAGQT